jgi:PST family polysaccharide transporter
MTTVSSGVWKDLLVRVRAASFLLDFSSTFASRLASKVIMAFVVAVAARRLGPEVFGAYVAILAYAGMAASLVDFGLAPYITRTISEGVPARQPLRIAATIRIAICAVLVTCASLVAFVGGMDALRSWLVVYVAASLFIDLLSDLLLAALRGYGRFHTVARTTIVRGGFVLLAAPVCLSLEFSITSLAFAFLLSSAAGLLYTAWQSRDFLRDCKFGGRESRDPNRSARAEISAAIGATWGFGVVGILGAAYMRLGPAVLANSAQAEVGVYGAAAKVTEAGLFAASIICSILVPYLSATRTASPGQYQRMVEACMRLMVIPSFLFSNLLIVLAGPLTTLLYGPKFVAATTVLEILSVYLLVGAVTGGAQWAILISMNEMKFASWLMAGALVVCVPLNLWLTPRYGAVGAAIACAAGEGLLLVANTILLERRGLDTQARLVMLCVALTVADVMAQHLPAPFPALAPAAYLVIFGWRCFKDLRWGVGVLSTGRPRVASPQFA